MLRQKESGPGDIVPPSPEIKEMPNAWRKTGRSGSNLEVREGLGEIEGALTLFPEAALFEQLHALEAFKDTALGTDGATAGF